MLKTKDKGTRDQNKARQNNSNFIMRTMEAIKDELILLCIKKK